MSVIEEYSYLYKERNITIKVGEEMDVTGVKVFYAIASLKNIIAFAECKEKALENCVKKIKFVITMLEKNISLIEQERAVFLAKQYFEENIRNQNILQNYVDELSYNFFVEDEWLTLNVTVSGVQEQAGQSEMVVIAVIYVNLITGECDMIENQSNIRILER